MIEKYALIKKIGDEHIYVENAITSRISKVGVVILGTIVIGSAIGFFFGMNSANNLNTKFIGALSFGFLSGIVSVMLIVISEVFLTKTPKYRVYTNDTNDEIYIPKTDNSEQDQIAICKAAQELEVIAIQRNREKNELERIASKCK
jgi:hypothetical protein